jgi:hypothetical protein
VNILAQICIDPIPKALQNPLSGFLRAFFRRLMGMQPVIDVLAVEA